MAPFLLKCKFPKGIVTRTLSNFLACLSPLSLSVSFPLFLSSQTLYDVISASNQWVPTSHHLLCMSVHSGPLVRSPFCPVKIDHISMLTLYPGYRLVLEYKNGTSKKLTLYAKRPKDHITMDLISRLPASLRI